MDLPHFPFKSSNFRSIRLWVYALMNTGSIIERVTLKVYRQLLWWNEQNDMTWLMSMARIRWPGDDTKKDKCSIDDIMAAIWSCAQYIRQYRVKAGSTSEELASVNSPFSRSTILTGRWMLKGLEGHRDMSIPRGCRCRYWRRQRMLCSKPSMALTWDPWSLLVMAEVIHHLQSSSSKRKEIVRQHWNNGWPKWDTSAQHWAIVMLMFCSWISTMPHHCTLVN